jgi:uncharacterized membrane protein YkoI
MRRSTKTALVAAAVAAAAGATTGIAVGGDDNATDTPITGDAVAKAKAVALAHTGGGRVTETEVGDDESRYEVEVTMPDGSQVDVQLDERFTVVGTDSDEESDG